jgi:hypothetical protein
VEHDRTLAKKYLDMAAANNVPWAHYYLGKWFENDPFKQPNYIQNAIRHYEIALRSDEFSKHLSRKMKAAVEKLTKVEQNLAPS